MRHAERREGAEVFGLKQHACLHEVELLDLLHFSLIENALVHVVEVFIVADTLLDLRDLRDDGRGAVLPQVLRLRALELRRRHKVLQLLDVRLEAVFVSIPYLVEEVVSRFRVFIGSLMLR